MDFHYFIYYCKKEQKKRSELFFINGVEKWENKCVFNGPIVNVVWNRCYKVCGMMMQFSCYPCRQWLDVKHNIEPNSIQMKRNLFHSEWMNGKNEFNHFIVLGRSENKAKKRKETVLLIGIDDVVFNWKSVFIWIVTHFESHISYSTERSFYVVHHFWTHNTHVARCVNIYL